MDVFLLLAALRRRWRVIPALAALGLVVGFASGSSPPGPEAATAQPFVATHTLALVDPGGSSPRDGGTGVVGPQLDTVGILFGGGDVSERAAALLGAGDDPGALAAQVRLTTDTELGTLAIAATDPDAARAEAVADAFAAALLERLTAGAVAQAEAQVATLQLVVDGLQEEIDRLSAEGGAVPTRVQQAQTDALLGRYRTAFDQLQTIQTAPPASGFVDLAEATAVRSAAADDAAFTTPTSRTGRATIGGLAGLLVGAVLAIVVDRLDNRIRTVEAAEAALEMPVIVSVPPLPRRFRRGAATLPRPGGAAEFDSAVRLLRATLMLAGGRLLLRNEADAGGPPPGAWTDPKLRTLLVTSANPSEGKSTLIAALARAMGSAPSRVIVLDLDLRKPVQHQFFGTPAGPGVAELFATATVSPAAARPGAVRREGAPPDGSSVLPAAPLLGSSRPPVAPSTDPRAVAGAAPAGPAATPGQDPGPRRLDDILVDVAPGVRLAPAGDASGPTELLSAGARLIDEARTRCDIVLIDAPPLLAVGEPSELAPIVDGVLVAVFAGRTTAGDAVAVSERLALLGASVVGAVLIGASPSRRSRRAARRYETPPSRLATDVDGEGVSANGSAPSATPVEPADLRGG